MSNLLVFLYVSAVLVVALASSAKRDRSAGEYFFAGRKAVWPVVGSSLALSNFLRFQIILLPLLATDAFWIAVGVSMIVVMISLRAKREEDDDGLDLCGSTACWWWTVGLAMITLLLVQSFAVLFLADQVLSRVLSLDYVTAAMMIIVVAGICVVLGGFSAVVHAQAFQAVVFLAGIIGLAALGDLPAPASIIQTSGAAGAGGLVGAILGLPVMSLWLWHFDPFSHQQVLALDGKGSRTRGLIAGGVVVAALGVIALMASHASPPEVRPMSATNILMVVCFAAFMASFAASFSSLGEITANAIFRKLRPGATDGKIVLIGRLATVAVVVLSVLMIPVAGELGLRTLDMFVLVQASLFPPLTAAYAARLLWRRLPRSGVVAAIVLGELLAIARIVFGPEVGNPASTNPLVGWFVAMDSYVFAFCLFSLSFLVVSGARVAAELKLKTAPRTT